MLCCSRDNATSRQARTVVRALKIGSTTLVATSTEVGYDVQHGDGGAGVLKSQILHFALRWPSSAAGPAARNAALTSSDSENAGRAPVRNRTGLFVRVLIRLIEDGGCLAFTDDRSDEPAHASSLEHRSALR